MVEWRRCTAARRFAVRSALATGEPSLDSTRPPQIVVEQVAACRDGADARKELERALGVLVAPRASWTVRARFSRTGERVSVHGEVIDPEAVSVATRTLTNSGTDCTSLAKGLAVWASLVLDAELDRARPPGEPPVEPAKVVPPDPLVSAWPEAPSPAEPRATDADLFLKHGQGERTVELGISTFVMGGTGAGAIVGPSAYGVFELAHGLFLRPALLGGHSIGGLTSTAEAPATFLASRFDVCARLPGFYRAGRGLQLDLCGGTEIGLSLVDPGVITGPPGTTGTLPFGALGPALDLRGELGANLSAILRGVGEVSFLRETVTVGQPGVPVSTPPFGGRAEVGLSWTLR
jgi:hypothetical protein